MSRDQDQSLPEELRWLVKKSVAILGDVVRYEAGSMTYRQIEKIRKQMADLHGKSHDKRQGKNHQEIYAILAKTLKQLRGYSRAKKSNIAHAFTLMLELINSCENAYRTYRLRQYSLKSYKKLPLAMIYVVTAHPTEARASANILVFQEIQRILTAILESTHRASLGDLECSDQWLCLKNSLELAWHTSTVKTRRPRVRDEAEHVYSQLLRDETLNALLASRREFGPIYIRSWVGGDKDGHPGVNARTLLESLCLSRRSLIQFFLRSLKQIAKDLALLRNTDPKLRLAYPDLVKAIPGLRRVRSGDGTRIRAFRLKFRKFRNDYEAFLGVPHPQLVRLQDLLQMFPALVVPMELREHSELIQEAAKGNTTAIGRMLAQVSSISKGEEPRFYVRGLVLSMVSSFESIQAAGQLVQKYFGEVKIPVIPLFEQEPALNHAPQIMKQMLEHPTFQRAIHRNWDGYLEVMLGYSDSAKELGLLASHLTIRNTVRKLDRLYRNYSITPVFFHGSGGSIDRGGGSIEEQTEWWPRSALQIYKATIQGEMVERTFASFEITRRRFEQIVAQGNLPGARGLPAGSSLQKAVEAFGSRVSHEYQNKTKSNLFLEAVREATPYRYLNILRLGSRPSAREKTQDFSKLRTIPWVLCWTQTRVLFPTWWGVGSAWEQIRASRDASEQLARLRRCFYEIPVFRSYIKVLSSTLARVELPVWRLYLENSALPNERTKQVFEEFQKEYELALDFVRALLRKKNLLWFRPWVGASIEKRSPMIHPLNLLQIIAIEESDHALLRETVTGIASGMMTTG